MKLQNTMEEIVMWAFKKHSDSLNLTCLCEKCRLDIMAIALNALPTYYSVSKSKKTYIKAKYIEKQHEVNVLSELANAAKIVSKKPQHE